jgi:hypothetical protein
MKATIAVVALASAVQAATVPRAVGMLCSLLLNPRGSNKMLVHW